ncbi:MAG TPA: MarR family transcriptional regulator [Marmoricola sp.]|jgi:DNA-binding MarR family transcriptional regulator|nr:MarR family transcriptional regulator [Marmoricola sp.]
MTTSSLALLLRQSESLIRQRLQPVLEEFDLTLEHWRIMSVLLDGPALPMSTLADHAVVPAATLTRHLDKLVERGMVVRLLDPSDKRKIVAALSPVGQVLADRLRADEVAVENAISQGLGEEHFRSLAAGLSQLPHVLI